MTMNRRAFTAGAVAGAASAMIPSYGHAKDLRPVRMGIGFKAMSPGVINLYVADSVGLAAENGIKIESGVYGTANNAMAAIQRGACDFGVVSSSFILPLWAKGEMEDIKIFYEYTYPYKWDIAVLPDSPIKTYQDLKSKHIGVSNLGVSDYPVTRTVLASVGIDPEKDVTWTAVGEGVTAGIALERKSIDALAYFDSGFGAIENAGIKLRYLPRPAKVPMIGGLFIGCKAAMLEKDKDLCIAYGRSVAEGSEFILANPSAGASAFLKMFPATAARNVSHEAAVAKTVTAIRRRIELYKPPYPNMKMGTIVESEFETEASMLGIKIPDLKKHYTNELIDAINSFDRGKIAEMAKNYKA